MDYIYVLLFGTLLINLIQKWSVNVSMTDYLREMVSCPLCLGVWVFTALSAAWGIDIVALVVGESIPVLNQFITGCVLSWVSFIFVGGLQLRYGTFG